MKRALLALCALALVQSLVAQEAADHPLVGRYPSASIQHQEVSNFGQYTILVGEEETETIQGEVWMTLYAAPGDSSTFSVYATYKDFLEAEGFTILVSCEPGECGGSTLQDAYGRAPFADHGNYNYSAPLTNGNAYVAGFISAKRERSDATTYVSIAIAAGWYDYPQYKLDVVDVAANKASIVSVGTREEEPIADAEGGAAPDGATAAPARVAAGTPSETGAGGWFSGTGSVLAQAGVGVYAFADPDFADGVTVFYEGPVVDVTNGGFRNLYGPYAEVSWFLNRNLGISAGLTYFFTEKTRTFDVTTIHHSSEMIFIQAGAMARVVGDAFPVTLGLGVSGGIVLAEFYQWSETTTVNGLHFKGDDFFPAVTYTAELTIPVVSVGRFAAALQYTFVPVSTLTFEHDGGSDYYLEYIEPNLGGLTLRIGLVAEF